MVTRGARLIVLRPDDRRIIRKDDRGSFQRRSRSPTGVTTTDAAAAMVAAMRTWTAQKHVDAAPAAVLDVICDTETCRQWSPVSFDLDEAAATRLAAGARMRVSGQLVGRRVGFDVEVHEAGDGRLALSAHGPVAFDVAYEARPAGRGSEVCASISLRSGSGLFGRLAEQATAALLHAGALGVAVDRIARSATA
jgi:ABC-type amino acid transport substrate-binding protein